MAIIIDFEPVKLLITQPETYSQTAENPGFKLYWRTLGRDPVQSAAEVPGTDAAKRAASMEKDVLLALGRISGVSIEQLIIRHLPGNPSVNCRVIFVPGADLTLAAQDDILAVNVFALEMRGTKLFLGDFPLLSLLANRIHQLCSEKLAPVLPANSSARAVGNVLHSFLKEGSATLFFTMPVSGPVYSLWQKCEQQRDLDIEMLRNFLGAAGGDKAPSALTREMDQAFALTGAAALAARYPLGTWMCQVIESAFGRPRLVALLEHPEDFVNVFEQARNKFGLPEKYCLAVKK